MAKFCGIVGYVSVTETTPGVFKELPIERKYYGDLIKHSTRWENGNGINDDININNEISILADPYAFQHFSEIRYVEFMGALWKVISVSVERPRLILSLGGLYNGQQS